MIQIPYYSSAWDAARQLPHTRDPEGNLLFGLGRNEMNRAIELLGSSYRSVAPRFAFEVVTRYLVRLKLIEPDFVEPPELMAKLTAERMLV